MITELSVSDSFAGRIDPRIKIVVVLFFSIVTALAYRLEVLFLALMLGALVVALARVPIAELFKRLIPVNLLMLFLWLFLPFTFPGQPLFFWGPLAVTREGVFFAVLITIKANAMMLMLIALVASTPIFTLGHAMHELGIPKKLVHLFFFTYRYIHVMHREYVRLLNSMKIRGFSPRNSYHTYKTVAYMVGMLLVRSFDRAQRVHNAMLCRGFSGNLYSLSNFSINKRDIVCLVLMTAAILMLGVMEWQITI